MKMDISKLVTGAAIAVFLNACGGKEEPAAPAGEAGTAPTAEVAPA